MACCDWNDFEIGVTAAFRRRGAADVLIDWPRARKDWKRHHCTGGEAAAMQLLDLSSEGDYLRVQPKPQNRDNDGGLLVAA